MSFLLNFLGFGQKSKKKTSNKKKRKPSAFTPFVLALFGLGFLLVLVIGAFYLTLEREFPDVAVLKKGYVRLEIQKSPKPPIVFIESAKPKVWVESREISKYAIGAVIMSEDSLFYKHKGYDSEQIKEAIKEDFAAKRFVRGASTITQQVAKNVFLERDKNIWRKLKELVLAMELEEVIGKRKILEIYFNIAEWGEGLYGIGAASKFYFGKAPIELNPREWAFLAMLLPSPKKYAVSFRLKKLTSFALSRINDILEKMFIAGYLSESEYAEAQKAKLSFEKPETNQPGSLESLPQSALNGANQNDETMNDNEGKNDQ